MAQARGTQTRIIIYDETTYGVDPGTPDGQILRIKTATLGSTQEKIDSETLPDVTDNRERTEPMAGNIDAGGTLVLELSAEQIDKMLKHALGGVSIGRPVSAQPVNITGVVVVRAETTCTTGNGTLAFTAAGQTLTWAAATDTAGAAVAVGAGGTFTLQSNTANRSLTVNVTPGSLPVGNQNDATITVVAAYEKEFSPGDLPVGLCVDKDYGSNITGAGRVENLNGVRVGSVTFNFPQKGPMESSFELKGANSSLASAALDATPTDLGHTPFSGFNTRIQEGGAGLGVLTEGSLQIDNGLDEEGYTIPGTSDTPGVRKSLTEGFAGASGSITAIFQDAALITKAINDTESSLKFTVSRGDGWGTAGNESVIFDLRHLKYERKTPDIDGPAGLKVNLNYKTFRDKTLAESGVRIIVRNQVATF
jgi:Phage tail tube protein